MLPNFLGKDFDLSQIEDTGIEAWRSVLEYGSSPANLALANLKVGSRSWTTGPDLALFNYGMSLDDGAIVAHIENLGAQPSEDGKLKCSTGLPDDFVAYGTDEEKWAKLPETAIPIVASGAAIDLKVPWDHSALTGYWPIKCEIEHGADRYHVNNVATKVFLLGGGR
jgi:hypothetical protein